MKIIKIIFSLIFIIFSSILYAIEIEGSLKYRKQVEGCLNLLSKKAKIEYKMIKDNIGIISQNGKSGMRAWENPPRYQMSDRTAFYSLTWCAGTIAHDAYHSFLYKKYSPVGGGKPPYEKWAGISSEKKSIDFQLSVMGKIGASGHEINYLKSLDGTHGDVNGDGKLDNEDYRLRNW
jgi:hypothetical protein